MNLVYVICVHRMYICRQSVEDMGMLTVKEKNGPRQHTLRDQSALHYWVCSLWTLKKALQWFKSPCLQPTEVSLTIATDVSSGNYETAWAGWNTRLFLSLSLQVVLFFYKHYQRSLVQSGFLHPHWLFTVLQWLPFYFSLASLSFFLFCCSCLLLPTVNLCRSLHLWVYSFFPHHRHKPLLRFQSLFKCAFAYWNIATELNH